MKLERITENNLSYAVQIQAELFPGESSKRNYEESLELPSRFEYYLLYEDGICAGITGIYWYPEDPDSAWLGWFGIREAFRRKGLGSEALAMFEEMAASKGFRFARLYTDAENNDAAIAFYRSNGYRCERYQNPEDPACTQYKTLIFSKALTSGEPVLWNSRNIHLTEQIDKQRSAGVPAEKTDRSCVLCYNADKKEDTNMSENKKHLSEDEISKVNAGLVMQFPDGWYVCSDDKERRQIYGPYKDEDRACEIAARNGYSYEIIFGPVIAPAKEK